MAVTLSAPSSLLDNTQRASKAGKLVVSVPKCGLSEGFLSKGCLSKGCLSEGCLSEGCLSKGCLSKGCLSKGVLLRVIERNTNGVRARVHPDTIRAQSGP